MQTLLEHLHGRHMNTDLHLPIICEKEYCATFYLYNLSRSLIGYQQYRPYADKKPFNHPKNSRYYTYRKQPVVSVWGLESFYINNNNNIIFICEGIFDAVRFTKRGYSAIATLCNSPPKDYRNWLDCIPRRKVAICDSDKPGIELKNLSNNYEIVEKYNDIGEASEDYVSYVIDKWANSETVH